MTSEEWQRVRPILESALELDSAHRPAYLDGACVDRSLRREVESLIAVHEQAGTGLLNSAAAPDFFAGDEARFRLPPGKLIGAYEIIEEIAVGGMGAVYRAIRADGQYKQQVALKIVRSELGTEFTSTRFKNERQILATLNHPNIARILDGGATAEGMPYFVMELVEGQRLDEYCDTQKLPTNERLGLFLQVCSAVQYAHQRLIIHRDIKPGNILVNAEGVPKLLDFGIAKILESSEASNQPEQTISLVRLLTPEYASPEQVKGEPITTASDVYSLGVVLFELLTGRTPYNAPTHTPHEISRAVCEAEPEKPSTAVRRKQLPTGDGEGKLTDNSILTAVVREGSPEKLCKRLRGDLDNIVLMALRKEPNRRYTSAEQFAQDIRRHLDHLPVLARKDTAAYRASKFITRHRAAVAAAVLVTITLLAALGVTLREARIARANALRAEQRFNDVRKLANSLMFEVHDSIRDLPGATGARKLIIQRAQEYLDSLMQESKSDPALLRELAAAYARLASVQGNGRDANVGDTSKAVQNYRKAAELLEADVSLEPANREARLELAQTYKNLGMSLRQAGDKSGNKEATQKALRVLESLAASNPDDQKTQAALGDAYSQLGYYFTTDNLNQSLNYQEKALGIYQRLAQSDPKNELYETDLSFSHKRVAALLADQNQLPPALEHERTALAIDERQLTLHPESVKTRFNITFTYSDTGFILAKQKDFDAALNYYRKAREIRAALAAADPQDTRAKEWLSSTQNYIGWVLQEKADFAGALDSYKKGLALREMLSEKDLANEPLRFKVAQSQANIGGLYAAMAFRPGVAAKDELAYCRESETWDRKALPMWQQMKTQGKLITTDLQELTKITQNLEKCGHITERMSKKTSPAMPLRPN